MQTLDAQALSTEDWQTIAENSEDPLDNDDVEGWVDEIPLLTCEERGTLENQVRPVRIALAKIRKLAFKIIHSTTIVLLAWDATCAEMGFKQKRIPRDVSTHWNSAFNMLDVGISYQDVVEVVTNKRKLRLTELAIDEHEWELLRQLRSMLKVRMKAYLMFDTTKQITIGPEGCHAVLFTLNTKPRHGNPGDGLH
ncbi:hypothetical protein SCLCIDRAFT_114537 [Scleroderma citrinum Foug A]|uniref:Uncharacterized protein n=1 Tax=Scleroderma citrinum Foug A TaxID=1036808 RepID=A0A0C2ZT66_9AGAM|nr:hypothetical protein SCLCIDRAFT_114537 [Scleroderma citrinum Foug A]